MSSLPLRALLALLFVAAPGVAQLNQYLIDTGPLRIRDLILESAALPGDPTRIASQSITGIGFLGAGAIIRGSGGVSGLTSAATIWFLGGLGILIGCRYPITGILLALTVVVLLSAVSRLEGLYARVTKNGRGVPQP